MLILVGVTVTVAINGGPMKTDATMRCVSTD
jgi:hypothetical protein